MFSRYLGQSSQKLQIQNIKAYSKTPADLALFVNNVQIDYEGITKQYILEIIQRFPIQWVIPIRNLCMRYITQLKIFINLHVIFLQNAIKQNCILEALPVVEAEAFHFKMDEEYQNNLLYLGFIVYLKLGQLEKAYKKLQAVVKRRGQFKVIYSPEKLIIPYMMLSRLYGGVDFRMDDLLSMVIDKASIQSMIQGPKKNQQIIALLQMFVQYSKSQKISKQLDSFIQGYVQSQKSGLLVQIYQYTRDQFSNLRDSIASLKSQQLQRVCTSQVLQHQLSNPQTMTSINRLQNVAKYNNKQRILYFNYEKASADKINQYISKCYALNEAIKSAGILREKSRGGLGSIFERIGGGGIGGMGGGMMEMMGMMGMSGRRHHHF